MKTAIIGFGCAGFTAARTIREIDRTAEIKVFNKSGEAPANPMLTSYYAEGRIGEEGIYPYGSLQEITERLRLDIVSDPVSHLYCAAREVETEAGTREGFDSVLIATGALPVVPRGLIAPGYDPFVLRSYANIRRIMEYLDSHTVETAVVIGCSWVGIKAAELLRARGARVLMLDAAGWLFPTVAYPDLVESLYPHLEELDVTFRFDVTVSQVSGSGVLLEGGEFIPSDFTCLCIGVRSDTAVVAGEDIAIGRGLTVDRHMRTSCAGIYAAGDCCEVYNPQTKGMSVIGLMAAASEQGTAAGSNIAGVAAEYAGDIPHNITHFFDIDFIGMGDTSLPGKRVSFSRGGDKIELTVDGEGKLLSINILKNYRIAGFLRSHLMKQLSGIETTLSDKQMGQLKAEGFPEEFIRFIGSGEL